MNHLSAICADFVGINSNEHFCKSQILLVGSGYVKLSKFEIVGG